MPGPKAEPTIVGPLQLRVPAARAGRLRPEALGLGRGGACNRGELGVPCPGLTPLPEASGLVKGPIR